MELRIFCKKGNCQNMIRIQVKLGIKIKDILYVHGWVERPEIGPVCTSCQNLEYELRIENQVKNRRKSA